MAVVSNRNELKDYCLRQLGFPVITINIDDDQLDDRIDDALQYFQDYHFDSLEKLYTKHILTQLNINQQFIPIPGNIIGITRIFPVYDSQLSRTDMFDLRYQLRLHELYDFTSASYVNYNITMQHLRSLELLFSGEQPIRFQRHQQKLNIDWSWKSQKVGQAVVIECYGIIDPDDYPSVWNDRFLKKYATALIKKQWGSNLKKFAGVQLPGGVTLNGDVIYKEAMQEIKEIEDDMEKNYGGPLDWFVG